MSVLAGIMGIVLLVFIESVKILSITAVITGVIIIPLVYIIHMPKNKLDDYENANEFSNQVLRYYIRGFIIVTLMIGYYDLHQISLI
ncbi:MAG: hypothetical protein ABFD08_18660 [Syntrophomonas sp.]